MFEFRFEREENFRAVSDDVLLLSVDGRDLPRFTPTGLALDASMCASASQVRFVVNKFWEIFDDRFAIDIRERLAPRKNLL